MQTQFVLIRSEVMRAMGETEVFATFKSPDHKGDIINFQMRFCALPLRNKGLGAIYSSVITPSSEQKSR